MFIVQVQWTRHSPVVPGVLFDPETEHKLLHILRALAIICE